MTGSGLQVRKPSLFSERVDTRLKLRLKSWKNVGSEKLIQVTTPRSFGREVVRDERALTSASATRRPSDPG